MRSIREAGRAARAGWPEPRPRHLDTKLDTKLAEFGVRGCRFHVFGAIQAKTALLVRSNSKKGLVAHASAVGRRRGWWRTRVASVETLMSSCDEVGMHVAR